MIFQFIVSKIGIIYLLRNLFLYLSTDLEMHTKVLENANKFSKIVTKFNLILTVFTAIGYCLIPIISNIYYHLIKGGPFLELMPMKTEFFYNISSSPNYEFSYILICVAMFCIVFSSVSVFAVVILIMN